MSLVIAENVTQLYGAQEVLRDVSFRIGQSDSIGLVGANGEGKTTLLRIMAGLLTPTGGQVHRAKGLRAGYLPQEPPAPEGGTLQGLALDAFAEARRAEEHMLQLSALMGGEDDGGDLLAEYAEAERRFEALGGYSYHNRVERVLTGLGFERDTWDKPLSEFSGGQLTRAYLARLLLEEPDLLLLDEPTNHLDMDSIEWLEGWLRTFRRAMIVVSHDRYFLDSVTKRTWEVASGGLETYRSPYTGYLTEKERRRKEQMRVWESQQDYIERTREFIRTHIAGQRSREARGRRTRLERFLRDEAVERPPEEDSISVSLEPKRHTGDQVLIAEDLKAGYDPVSPLVTAERLEVFSGDRIAVLGPNGIGKTTLLRTLLGELPPLSGTVRRGSNVDIGYLSQTHGELDPDQTALESVLGAARGAREQAARDILGGLLLSGDDAFKRTGDLSGGERSRVLLAQLAIQSANVLFLDEPTNHLDMPSTEIMQELLGGFAGTIIFVSHDRYLIRAVANRVWAFDDGRIRVIHGGWDHYVGWHDEKDAIPAAEKEEPSTDSERSRFERRRREARQLEKLRRRQEELEARIERTERELATLTDEISAWGRAGDVDRVRRLSESFAEKKGTLENLWREWESVGEELL